MRRSVVLVGSMALSGCTGHLAPDTSRKASSSDATVDADPGEPPLNSHDVPADVNQIFQHEERVGEWLMLGPPLYALTVLGDAIRMQSNPKDSAHTTSVLDLRPQVLLVREVPATSFHGKEVKGTLEISTAEGEASCLLLVLRDRQGYPSYRDRIEEKSVAVRSSRSFAPCVLSAKIPVDAKWILLGVSKRGAGSTSVRSPKLEEIAR